MVNRILEEGYQVIALSTCTGIDSYNKDDRMVALNLRQHVSDPDRYHVVMDELNDLEMGKILGACELTVGTRLHSAIISMNFATLRLPLIMSTNLPELCNSWDCLKWRSTFVICWTAAWKRWW